MDALGDRIKLIKKKSLKKEEERAEVVSALSLFLKPYVYKPDQYEGAYKIEREFSCLFPQFYNDEKEAQLDFLLSESEHNILCFWGLMRISARWLASDMTMPNKLKMWTLSYLRNEINMPKLKRGATKNERYHQAISYCAEILKQNGFKLSKNRESQHENSGYDLIVQALKIAGKNTTYSAIFSIHIQV